MVDVVRSIKHVKDFKTPERISAYLMMPCVRVILR